MMPLPNPRPNTFSMPRYSMRGSPMFIHPCALIRKDYDTRARQAHQDAFSVTEASNYSHATPPAVASLDSTNASMMVDMKISLAAKQLAEQAKENKAYWVEFREEFEEDVVSIRPYINEHILRQIWRSKVEHNNERNGGNTQHGGNFSIQNIKLETCMSQIDEAMRFLAAAESSHGHSTDHNPQRHHLEKIRAAGGLVVGLAKKSMFDEAACKDFLTELSDLERLLDPNNPAVEGLHPLNKGEVREAADIQGQQPGKKNKGKGKGKGNNRAGNNQLNTDAQAENNQPITDDQNEGMIPNETHQEPESVEEQASW